MILNQYLGDGSILSAVHTAPVIRFRQLSERCPRTPIEYWLLRTSVWHTERRVYEAGRALGVR
jgi:hypothetical protein